MASLFETDAATEALIAQMMAEDFGEVYTDHLRPIGSHAGDYEEPLSSYERQCLENPDMQDQEGGWNPPTPRLDPIQDTATLPEGESWDSNINDDPMIESTPAFAASQHGESDEDTSEGGVSLEEPLHHIQDTISYHADTLTQSPSRHASLPALALTSKIENGRRVISDPSRLETIADTMPQDPPSLVPIKATQLHPPEPDTLLPKPSVFNDTEDSDLPYLSRLLAPPVRTNERLLDLINDTSNLNLNKSRLLNESDELDLDLENFGNFDFEIDTSSSKNKGKASTTDTPTDPDGSVRTLMGRYKALVSNPDFSRFKNKRKTHSASNSFDQLLATDTIDEESGMLILRVPWPESSRRDREFREAMDAQVHEIWVGEEETVESILRDIEERREIGEREWGSWGDESGGGDGSEWGKGKEKEKGKGKAVEC